MIMPKNKYDGNGRKLSDIPEPTVESTYERLCDCANRQISVSFSATEVLLLAAFTTRLLAFAKSHGIGKEASEPNQPTEETKT